MTASLPLHLAFALVGAVNAGLLAGVLGYRGWQGRDGVLIRLAALCGALAAAMTLIVLVHGAIVPETVTTILLELGLTLFAGMVLYDFVRAATTRALPLWSYLLLPALGLLIVLFEGGTETGLDRLAVSVQMVFTLLAVIHWLRFGGPEGERDQLVFAVLLGVTLIHVAQTIRTNASAFGAFEDVVPLLGAIVAVGITIVVLLRAGLVQRLQAAPVKSDTATVKRFELLLEEDQLYLNPKLTLSDVAAKLGVPPQRLSTALNVQGPGFYERIARARVAEAQRLLRDPAEARTSVEAVALLAGFKSRSSFYEAFRAETGMTPAAFRKSG
jgi:AraC-like DNA-binding protein